MKNFSPTSLWNSTFWPFCNLSNDVVWNGKSCGLTDFCEFQNLLMFWWMELSSPLIKTSWYVFVRHISESRWLHKQLFGLLQRSPFRLLIEHDCLIFHVCNIFISHSTRLVDKLWVHSKSGGLSDGLYACLHVLLGSQSFDKEHQCRIFHKEDENPNDCRVMYIIGVIWLLKVVWGHNDWDKVKWVDSMWLHLGSYTFRNLADILRYLETVWSFILDLISKW